MHTEVCARLSFIAFHHWPDAPTGVGYLRATHRHRLVVRAWVAVAHNDRQVEFHTLARELRRTFETSAVMNMNHHGELELGEQSCEDVAAFLLRAHPMLSRVEAWEDDEMGAIVFRE